MRFSARCLENLEAAAAITPAEMPVVRATAVAARTRLQSLTRGRDLGLPKCRDWLGGTALRIAANAGDADDICRLLCSDSHKVRIPRTC